MDVDDQKEKKKEEEEEDHFHEDGGREREEDNDDGYEDDYEDEDDYDEDNQTNKRSISTEQSLEFDEKMVKKSRLLQPRDPVGLSTLSAVVLRNLASAPENRHFFEDFEGELFEIAESSPYISRLVYSIISELGKATPN